MFRIKICGITTPEDAELAADAGADAIGLNFYAQSKRFVEPEVAQEIAARTRPEVAKVGVFVNESIGTIEDLVQQVPLDYVQLHGDEPPEALQSLADIPVIKAFRCQKIGFAGIVNYLADCDANSRPAAVLVDAYHHAEYGGTGVALDWIEVGRQKSMLVGLPLLLAGGLTPENVSKAIRLSQPFGVDVASGVERKPGYKDMDKVQRFIAAAWNQG